MAQQQKYYPWFKSFYQRDKQRPMKRVAVLSRTQPTPSSPSSIGLITGPSFDYDVADEDEYKMDRSRRGRAIIINNYFEGHKKLERHGALVDEKNLITAFTKDLGFRVLDISASKDCTCDQILDVIDEASAEDYTDCDCLVVIVMTHGKEDLLLGYDEQCKTNEKFAKCYVTIDDISQPFLLNKSLFGKPKIFIFQACRGERKMIAYESTLQSDAGVDTHTTDRNRVPSYPDFLYIFSTQPSFQAYRGTVSGSWLITELCNAMHDARGKGKEFMDIVTEANRALSARNSESQGYYQVASIESTLLKELYFR